MPKELSKSNAKNYNHIKFIIPCYYNTLYRENLSIVCGRAILYLNTLRDCCTPVVCPTATPELSFPGAPYRFRAETIATINCHIISVPMFTFTQLVETMDNGSEVVRDSVADPVGDCITYRLSHTFSSIMLSRHNGKFLCRATNANGNTSISTIIEVFGELAILLDRSILFLKVIPQYQ